MPSDGVKPLDGTRHSGGGAPSSWGPAVFGALGRACPGTGLLLSGPDGARAALTRRLDDLRVRPGLSESLALTLAEFNQRLLGPGERAQGHVNLLARGAFAVVAGPGLLETATAVAAARAFHAMTGAAFAPLVLVDLDAPWRGAEPAAPDPEARAGPAAALARRTPRWGSVLASLRAFRPEGLPLFEQELLDPDGIHATRVAAGRALEAAGVPAPFADQGPLDLVFESDAGTPQRVLWDGEEFETAGEEVEPFDLLSRLERLAPGPPLQPLLAEMALPVACWVLDGRGAAAFAQIHDLFAYFGLPEPLALPVSAVEFEGGLEDRWRDDPVFPDRLVSSLDVLDFGRFVVGRAPAGRE